MARQLLAFVTSFLTTVADSPDARFEVEGLCFFVTVCASGGKTLISRISFRCVRHLPRPTGLPAHGSSHLFTRTSLVKSRLPPSSVNKKRPLWRGCYLRRRAPLDQFYRGVYLCFLMDVWRCLNLLVLSILAIFV